MGADCPSSSPLQVKQALKVMMASVHMQVTHACQVRMTTQDLLWVMLERKRLVGRGAVTSRRGISCCYYCAAAQLSRRCCRHAGVL